MVDFDSLSTVLFDPRNFLVAVILLTIATLCIALRWFVLVRALGLAPSLKEIVSLTMVGNFFTTFMPGAIGGDVIKAWYIAGHEPKRKARAISTIVVDRLVGLSVFALYASLALFFYLKGSPQAHRLEALSGAIWITTTLLAIGTFLFFWPKGWEWSVVKRTLTLLGRVQPIAHALDAALSYRVHFKSILIAVRTHHALGKHFNPTTILLG